MGIPPEAAGKTTIRKRPTRRFGLSECYPTVLVVLYAVPHFKQGLSAELTVRTVYPQLVHCRT